MVIKRIFDGKFFNISNINISQPLFKQSCDSQRFTFANANFINITYTSDGQNIADSIFFDYMNNAIIQNITLQNVSINLQQIQQKYYNFGLISAVSQNSTYNMIQLQNIQLQANQDGLFSPTMSFLIGISNSSKINSIVFDQIHFTGENIVRKQRLATLIAKELGNTTIDNIVINLAGQFDDFEKLEVAVLIYDCGSKNIEINNVDIYARLQNNEESNVPIPLVYKNFNFTTLQYIKVDFNATGLLYSQTDIDNQGEIQLENVSAITAFGNRQDDTQKCFYCCSVNYNFSKLQGYQGCIIKQQHQPIMQLVSNNWQTLDSKNNCTNETLGLKCAENAYCTQIIQQNITQYLCKCKDNLYSVYGKCYEYQKQDDIQEEEQEQNNNTTYNYTISDQTKKYANLNGNLFGILTLTFLGIFVGSTAILLTIIIKRKRNTNKNL